MRKSKVQWKGYRYLYSLLSIITILSGFRGYAVYGAQTGAVYDDAALLTGEETEEINSLAASITEKTGWTIYAVTTEDAQGKSAEAYADDFFDEHSQEQEDGAVALIDMDNRDIYLSTSGITIRYVTDERKNQILDDAYTDISDGDYEACLAAMLNGVSDAYDSGIPDDQYNYDRETGEISYYYHLSLYEVLFAVVAALITGGIVFACITGRYRIKFGGYSYDPHASGKVDISKKNDRLVGSHTTHRRIETSSNSSSSSSSSGSRSTTHHSSSGNTHGGGGRHF